MAIDQDATTLRRERVETPLTSSATYVLAVVEGPDAGKTFTLDGTAPSSVLVGQGPACEIRLTDRQVSRRHASIDFIDRRLQWTDVGSRNGTSINGVAVGEAFLSGGEIVRIGATTLRVDLVEATTTVPISTATSFGNVLGASLAMRRLYPLCERIAAAWVPVLIEGETGTGKEVLAEAIHDQGPRAAGPFVVFDCTAVPPTLVESDLFGHERGAFTGAAAVRKGVFEQAHGGTLLIDEIGDLDLALQPKLLRALERSEIRRVGGDRPIRVDVRVLCATRRNLDQEVAAGRFRDDLYHRLAVARIELPPLRRRREDIRFLAHAFASLLDGGPEAFPEAVLSAWEEYDFPGNVRELKNRVAQRIALGDLAAASPVEDAPRSSRREGVDGIIDDVVRERLPYAKARARVLAEFEQRYVAAVLADHDGNVARAARASGVARRQFQRVKARSQK